MADALYGGRWFRTLNVIDEANRQALDAYLFESLSQVRQITENWLVEYNEEQPHESLGSVPPLTFMPRQATDRVSII